MPRFLKLNNTINDGRCAICSTTLIKSPINWSRDHNPPQSFFSDKMRQGDPVVVATCHICHKKFDGIEKEFVVYSKLAGDFASDEISTKSAIDFQRFLGIREASDQITSSDERLLNDMRRTIGGGIIRAGERGSGYKLNTIMDFNRFSPIIRKIVNALSIHHNKTYLLRNFVPIYVAYWFPAKNRRSAYDEQRMAAALHAAIDMPYADAIGAEGEFTYKWDVSQYNAYSQTWFLRIRQSMLIMVSARPLPSAPPYGHSLHGGALWAIVP